jgi:hypothetical protein
MTHWCSEHSLLSTTGNLIATSFFVEAAAVFNTPDLHHVFTMPGLAYMAESRAHTKFLAVSANFAAISASSGSVAVFKRPAPGESVAPSVALQEHEDSIMGLALGDKDLMLLTEKEIFLFQVNT